MKIKNNNRINSNLFERSTPPIGISLSSSLIPLLPGCGKAMYLGITGGLGDLQKTNKYPAIGVTQGWKVSGRGTYPGVECGLGWTGEAGTPGG